MDFINNIPINAGRGAHSYVQNSSYQTGAKMDFINNIPMNAGRGAHSYVQNSSYQRGAMDAAISIIEEEIMTKFNIKDMVRNEVFIADFGCSTGHNSFPAIEIITQAINRIYESTEFHVLFSDLPTNDFNTLFTSLPPQRVYQAIAVPGDFHGRLLPKSSLHFAYSSIALHWLTQVPVAVTDSASPAWNKGAIIYTENKKEVCDAYFDQFSKDIEAFLESRAVEMVGGGLMALLVPAVPEFWDHETEYTIPCDDINLLGSCLMDMTKKGRLSEAKLDSSNIPTYYTTPQQFKGILERSHSFSIERMEILDNPGKYSLSCVDARAAVFRAAFERTLTYHFGGEIIDELFDLYKKKLAASPVFLDPNNDKSIVIFAMLKRKVN